MIIAIDGPAASGKGTLARRLAAELDLAYLDSGSLYRATGLAVMRAGGDPRNEADAVAAAKALDITSFSPEDLRSEEAGVAASHVAFIPAVRQELLAFQRRFAETPPGGKKGAVMDGRDIGTVVCPDAAVKIFVKARLPARVRRRIKELQNKGESVNKSRVWADMKARDARDKGRSVAPLVAAKDAWVLDTTDLDADQAFAAAKAYIAVKSKR